MAVYLEMEQCMLKVASKYSLHFCKSYARRWRKTLAGCQVDSVIKMQTYMDQGRLQWPF